MVYPFMIGRSYKVLRPFHLLPEESIVTAIRLAEDNLVDCIRSITTIPKACSHIRARVPGDSWCYDCVGIFRRRYYDYSAVSTLVVLSEAQLTLGANRDLFRVRELSLSLCSLLSTAWDDGQYVDATTWYMLAKARGNITRVLGIEVQLNLLKECSP